MSVIGLNIKTMNSERKDTISGNISVNSSPKIIDVGKKKISSLGNKEALSIKFNFKCDYTTDNDDETVATIEIGGNVLYLVDDPEEVTKKWEKNKELSDKIVVQSINHIMRKCLIRSINISESLQLPPPLRFPKAKKKKKSSKYIS